MTAYIDFTSDFSKRCLAVLDAAFPVAEAGGREITLLFMAASASFLVPFERLKPDSNDSVHPFGDNKRYGATAGRLKDLLAKNFVGSGLCNETNHSWKLAKGVLPVDGKLDLDNWPPTANLKPLEKQRKIGSTLTLIRNALAHGSIYTKGNPIDELVFVKEVLDKNRKRVGFDVLQVSHEDFTKFVRAWIGFLQAPDSSGSNP